MMSECMVLILSPPKEQGVQGAPDLAAILPGRILLDVLPCRGSGVLGMEDCPNLLRISEEGYVERAIGLKFFVVVGRVCVRAQDRRPHDHLQANGGICQVGLPKGGVINHVRWAEYVSNDIGKGYAS